jgi:hypothetical protein
MDIFEILNQESRARGLQFMVMGVLADNAHGYERLTEDVDLIVKRIDREKWTTMLDGLGCKVLHEQDAVIQLSAPQNATLIVNIILINDEIFTIMLAESIEVGTQTASVRIFSVEHLITLRLCAESNTIRASLDAMIRLSDENLLSFNNRPGLEERRLRDKHNVEFVL